MDWSWMSYDGKTTRDHAGHEDLVVDLLEPRFLGHRIIVKRINQLDGRVKTDDDMYIEVFGQISSRWLLIADGELREHDEDPIYLETLMRVQMSVPSNQRGQFSLFPCIRVPPERDLPIPPEIVFSAYRQWDLKYWRKLHIVFTPIEWYEIWKQVRLKEVVIMAGHPWTEYRVLQNPATVVPTLRMLCMRKLSWLNVSFTGDKNGGFAVHTVSNLYPMKLPRMLEKFDKPTKVITPPMKLLGHLVPGALEMLYEAIGTRPVFRTQVWDYETEKLYAVGAVRKNTSAGLRAGPKHIGELEGIKLVGATTGKKKEQLPYAVGQLDNLVEQLCANKDYVPQDCACQVTLKDESFNKTGMNESDARELPLKLRPYYILSLFQYLMACMCLHYRQTVERGRVIKIGMSFWFGGATALAMGLGFDDPAMVFEDGDFKHLDTSIHMILLMLYVTQASVYFNWKAMTEQNVMLLRQFFRICAERLSIKVTHIFSTIWRVIYGGMPSGAYETSHGDSWIVAFLYFLYIRQVMERNPERAAQIRRLFRLYRCGIIVYGDDHVLYTHKDVHDIINETGFARFVADFWGMRIRDIHRAPFLTVPNPYTGGIITPGIVFLKRYFVRATSVFTEEEILRYEISPIVPYRPLEALVLKYSYGKADEKSVIEYIVSSIGMAYDTQGTNRPAYEFCQHMYNRLSATVFGNIQVVLREFMDKIIANGQDTYITRLMRTAAITDNDIVSGFPTWESLIRRHKYSTDYVNFGGYKTELNMVWFN